VTEYEKHRLPQATILSKTRYIGFNRQPLTDASRNIVSTEKASEQVPAHAWWSLD
jgi:hypothetical protein